MENFQTFTRKGDNGWRAETVADIGGGRQLQLFTRKMKGKLVTAASVGRVDGAFFTHVIFEDFYRVLERADVRVTEKAVQAQHAEYLEMLPAIVADAEEHYATKGGAA